MPDSTPSVPDPQRSFFARAGRAAIVLTALTQIVLFPGFLFPFVTTRNVFFRVCVEIAVAAVLLAGVQRLRDVNDRDPILKWFFGYLIAIGVAAMFGLSPWHSLFGDFERMGGVWAWVHLLLFYLVLRMLMQRSNWVLFFRLMLLVSTLVVVWGAAEFLPAGIRNPLFQSTLAAGSTIGNPGLLAPYLLLCLALSCWLMVAESRRWRRTYAAISAAVLLFGIAGSRNRSSELGLLAGALTGAVVFFLLHRNRKRLARTYVLVGSSGLALLVAASLLLAYRSPEMADRFGGRWKGFLSAPIDYSRTIEWKIALEGFRDRPLLGYGPENHQIVSSHHFDPKIYEVLGEETFDRTHNAWLELLATSGLAGTLAMIGIWVAAIGALRTGVRESSISGSEAAILSGAFASYAVYLTFWFFDINSLMVWVVILAFLANRVYGPLRALAPQRSVPLRGFRGRAPVLAAVAAILLTSYLHGVVPLMAAHDLSVAAGGGVFAERLNAFQRVMNSSAPQTLHTFPLYYRFLRSGSRFATAPGASPFFRRQFDLALQRGMIEADRNISRNSEDDRSYVDAARFSMLAGSFYRDTRYLILARNELVHAVRISPRRPDARVFLSAVYQSLGDSAKGRAQLDSAMLLAPEYGGSFFFAARIALARNNPDSAAALLTLSLDRKFPGNELVVDTTVSALVSRGENLRAARLAQKFLESGYGPLARWKGRYSQNAPVLSSVSELLANRLPILYLKADEPNAAIAAAIAFASVQPKAGIAAADFVSAVRSGGGSSWKGKPSLIAPDTLAPSLASPKNVGGATNPP